MKRFRGARLGTFVIVLGLVSGTLGLSLSGCAGREPIRVGFAAEMTGKQSDLGAHGRNGARLAVETLNAAGGIDGRPIELLVRDDQGTSEGAQAADRELIEAGVVAIVGHMTSGQTMAAYPVTEAAGMVLLSPAATTPDLSGRDDLFFRVVPSHLAQAQALARHARLEYGLARVAGVRDEDNDAYTRSYWAAFADEFRALGGQVVGEARFSSSEAPDFGSLVAELRSSDPQGVLIMASALDTAFIAQQTRLNGWQVPLFASAWAQTEVLIQTGGQAVDGLETTIVFDVNSQSPAFLDFKARYQERFGLPPTFAAGEAYEAVLVLAAALGKTGGRAQGLPQALLETQDSEGLIGRISLDAYGDAERSLFLIAVQDGRFVTVTALEP